MTQKQLKQLLAEYRRYPIHLRIAAYLKRQGKTEEQVVKMFKGYYEPDAISVINAIRDIDRDFFDLKEIPEI
jgi:hypothetical protein